jgi:phage tail-like protein
MPQNTNALPMPAMSVSFSVSIDGQDLGSFMSCEGLAFEVQVETREEGGNNGYVHQLPGRVTYPTVKFKRPLNSDSQKLQNWFAKMQYPIKRTTASIRAMTADGIVVATYNLKGVIPVKWSGPQLTSEQAQIATETFEIAHHGFLSA